MSRDSAPDRAPDSVPDSAPDPRVAREAERIRVEYARRAQTVPDDFYRPSRPANLFLRQGQERALLWALSSAKLLPLDARRILEIGCGTGRWLRLFNDFGADRARLAGIDLDQARLGEAIATLPEADLRVGDAAQLPWPGATFDLIFQSTVFTSVLDDTVRGRIAQDMLRVLAPGGAILWYDFRVDNPNNPHVRGVPRRELRSLFPDCSITVRRTTLAPPIARRLVPRSWPVAALLDRLRLLNTHDTAVIRPR